MQPLIKYVSAKIFICDWRICSVHRTKEDETGNVMCLSEYNVINLIIYCKLTYF